MRHRFKHFEFNGDMEALFKRTKDRNALILSNLDVTITELQKQLLTEEQEYLKDVLIWERHHKAPFDTNEMGKEDIDAFIEIIKTIHNLIKSPDVSKEIKAYLVYFFRLNFVKIEMEEELKAVKEELFRRRNEIDHDNPLFIQFLDNYIGEQIYFRFYEQEIKELEKQGIDTDEYYENMTEEEEEKHSQKHTEHFKQVCQEYGIDKEALRNYQDGKEKDYGFKIPDDLPEDVKKAQEEIERLEAEEGDTPR